MTGTPTAPTPATGDNTTKVATTAYVKAQNYITGNQAITVAGDASGSGTTSLTITNNGLKGAAIPTLAPGNLRSNGTTWSFDNTAYLTGNQNITLAGDLSGSGSTSITAAIGSGSVTLGKMASLPANTLIGNNTASPTTGAYLTTSQIKTMLTIGESDVTNLATDLSLKAPLTSPALVGAPTAPTLSADTNTTGIATTAYVTGQAGSATPIINGTAVAGTSLRYARQDHIHPTDTSRAPIDNPTFTTGITTPAITINSADGTHYVQPYNGVAFSGTPVEGMIQTNSNGLQIYHNSAWVTVGSGSVTSVTGTAPVVSSGGTTPAISMAAATDSVPGYMTATDHTSLTGKLDANGVTSSGGVLVTPQPASNSDSLVLRPQASNGSSGVTITVANAAVTPYTITLPNTAPAANTVFAAPNGSAGNPAFRLLVAADIPTLNQNTTGTAANLSGTPALPNGATATTQSASDNSTKLATTAYVDAGLGTKQNTLTNPLVAGTLVTGNFCTKNAASNTIDCNSSGTGSMTYPASGIANSTGSAWGTSYTTSGSGTVVALTSGPTFTGTVTIPTPSAQSNTTTAASTAYVDTAVPYFYSGTSISITRENSYAVCTGTCTVTPPAPAAGKQFCVRNSPGGSYDITLAALGAGNYYEKPDHSAYGTANGTFTATAATSNQVCFVGLDANHYLLLSAIGTWTAN
jgi:hypothetical protein